MNSEERNIIYGHSHLLTDLEVKAVHKIGVLSKIEATDSQAMKIMMTEKWLNKEAEVDELLKNGHEKCFQKIVKRIKTEEKVNLNTCPKCETICMTAKARLCPSCNHSWFEKRKET
jgi:hypothetical protein